MEPEGRRGRGRAEATVSADRLSELQAWRQRAVRKILNRGDHPQHHRSPVPSGKVDSGERGGRFWRGRAVPAFRDSTTPTEINGRRFNGIDLDIRQQKVAGNGFLSDGGYVETSLPL